MNLYHNYTWHRHNKIMVVGKIRRNSQVLQLSFLTHANRTRVKVDLKNNWLSTAEDTLPAAELTSKSVALKKNFHTIVS